MKKILLLLALVLLTFSCRKKVEIREVLINGSLFKTIEIDPDEFDKNNFTSILDWQL
jgi:hypothetical protein